MSKHFSIWNDRWDIAHPGDADESINFAAEHFINCAKEAIRSHNYFAVALSGGSTPKAIFKIISSAPMSSQIDWSKVYLFWGDERNVPPQHSDSNFRMAMDSGLKSLSISPENVFRMKAESDIQKNAQIYESKIIERLGSHSFDLVMLGMGDDGHTASLFPKTEALKEKTALVVANKVPQKNTTRMTLTYPCINRGANIVIYVLGKNKANMLSKIFLEKNTPPFPIELIGTKDNKALWILDTEAGEKIFKHIKK